MPDSRLWSRVSDRLIGGMSHALNNRVAAMSGVVQVLAGELPEGHPLREALVEELRRLQETVSLVGLLPREQHRADPVPVRLADVVDDALRLFRMDYELRDLPCDVASDPDAPPVRVEEALLLRAVLVALTTVGSEAARRFGGRIEVTCAGSPAHATLRVQARGGRAESGTPAAGPGFDADTFSDWVARLGGTVEAADPSEHISLRLPAMTEAGRAG